MYKFTEKPDDLMGKLLTEAEDNFATADDLSAKADQTQTFDNQEPRLKELRDGQLRAYDDGTNCYLYYRIGGRLIRFQGSEVV